MVRGPYKPRQHRPCGVEGCPEPHYGLGYCSSHYDRFRRNGDPLAGNPRGRPNGTVPEWLRSHIGHTGQRCLIWPFSRATRDGRAVGNFVLEGHGMMHGPCAYLLTAKAGPRPSPKHEAAHSCGKGHLGCVNPTHLRWATAKENIADKREHGTYLFGAKVPVAKLTDAKVRAILRSTLPQKELAAKYGVGVTCISAIFRGLTWRHIPRSRPPVRYRTRRKPEP